MTFAMYLKQRLGKNNKKTELPHSENAVTALL